MVKIFIQKKFILENSKNKIKRYIKLVIIIYYQFMNEAKIKDPKNLAKAISSLDCWAEQEEEKWQTWDIEKCKNNFLIINA